MRYFLVLFLACFMLAGCGAKEEDWVDKQEAEWAQEEAERQQAFQEAQGERVDALNEKEQVYKVIPGADGGEYIIYKVEVENSGICYIMDSYEEGKFQCDFN